MIALLENAKKVYNEYPRAFWIYNLIVFIDRLGGFMLYPFFALYLTQKYNIGMSTVGILFAIFSISGMVGSALGGALADRMGRKVVIIISLILSSLSALGMGLAPTLGIFIAVVAIVGTLSSIGHPAHEAVVADLLPPEKRAEGYGIIRIIFNPAAIINMGLYFSSLRATQNWQSTTMTALRLSSEPKLSAGIPCWSRIKTPSVEFMFM